jgi:protein SCO1
MGMNWRLASRLSVITMALLVMAVVAVLGTRNMLRGPISGTSTTNQSGLQGTDLGGTSAPDFTLTDQFGRPVSLSQFKGKPVILTFLYTHCPNVCPLTADKLHIVMQNLGADAQHIAVLAVSTDPKGDTTAAALNFSRLHKMQDYWHFLVGTHDELSPVWSSYRVYAAPATESNSTPGTVTHTTAIFVIDKQGHERVFYGDDFNTDQLTADVKILLGE